jgi:hypothetical protein
VVQGAVARERAAFGRCVEEALRSSESVALSGRRLGLLVAVDPSGTVLASEVDDAQVEAGPLGACLRRAASRLLFPPFEGDPVGIRIPLVIASAP